jgi:hypothetical protein
MVQMPAAGYWTRTFSTVSTLFEVPPGVDQLPVSSPLLPQNHQVGVDERGAPPDASVSDKRIPSLDRSPM